MKIRHEINVKDYLNVGTLLEAINEAKAQGMPDTASVSTSGIYFVWFTGK